MNITDTQSHTTMTIEYTVINPYTHSQRRYKKQISKIVNRPYGCTEVVMQNGMMVIIEKSRLELWGKSGYRGMVSEINITA